jgi:hypothetical protein
VIKSSANVGLPASQRKFRAVLDDTLYLTINVFEVIGGG